MKLNKKETKSIFIYSKEHWNDTDIEIQSGEEYLLEANGFWKDLGKKSDANGYSNLYMSLFNKLKRSRTNKWFALIGCLNKNNDFLIGKKNHVTFEQSGKLYCYANDVWCFYWNNSGYVELIVTRIN